MMQWKKQGLVFKVSGQREWMRTHATAPIPVHQCGDRYRVYFSSRDESNHSHVSYVDINITNPSEPLEICASPVLAPGGS